MGLAAATWVLRMVREDETERQRQQATEYARLVEAVALGSRGDPRTVDTIVKAWYERATPPGKDAPQAAPESPLTALATDPWWHKAVEEAGRPAAAPLPSPPATKPNGAAAVPVYKVASRG